MDLSPLLQHEEPEVRLIAALCLRNIMPQEAEHTMKELFQIPTMVGINAKYTYKEWKAGNLTSVLKKKATFAILMNLTTQHLL